TMRTAVRDDQQPNACVEEPRRRLPEHIDVEVVALRRGRLVTEHQDEVATENDAQTGPRHVVRDEEEDHGGIDHQPVGERIGYAPELGLDPPAACKEAGDLVSDTRGAK